MADSPRPFRPGIYRRRIRIIATPGAVRADLEDVPHRYGVIVRHDGETITAVEGIPIRIPMDLCSGATAVLNRLVGLKLSPDPLAVYRHTNGKLQCTHMFDMAGLAAAHAARGTERRQYDAEIPVDSPDGPRRAILRRDGVVVLAWTVQGTTILEPESLAGQNVKRLQEWTGIGTLDPDAYEALVVLRRATYISNALLHHESEAPEPIALMPAIGGACYLFQPGVAEHATRLRGSRRDFTHDPDGLLADLT